ncbi:MAG TPA: hypothetical protein PLS93_07380 [Accumulibacter sp.]|nr:hypothetical protein [Accumulibacter sp.]
MLVPFVIDTDSLAPDPAWTAAQVRTYHQSLLEVWQRIGLLTHDGDSFENSRLQAAVQQLPQKLRPLWQEILERVPLRACGNRWNGTVTAGNISQLSGITSLALVDDARAEVEFEFDDDELSKTVRGAPDIEVCRLISAGQATTFKTALDQSGMHIEAGDTFEDIWSLRFKELAAARIKPITIVDRFAVSQHMACPQTHLSGLARFLRLLSRDADGERHVTLLSALTDEVREYGLPAVKANLDNMIARLELKNIKRLKVFMVPNPAFGRCGHDRFFRFEKYVWDIGLGLKVFQGPFSQERSSAAFKTGYAIVSGYKQVEDNLRDDRGTKAVEVPA